jgi:phosphopantothenoylcysteine decarboxylase / phosphopantothenate---cysteine ligase
MLAGKKILLAVTGSIAAYKSALLVRLFIKEGAEVRVVMSSDAMSFVTPLTLETLSKHSVISTISDESSWNNHVELGLWADIMLVAPATANTLAKMANGICDNMVTACYLSAKCPVAIAPAMDLDMWQHPATQRNLNQLHKDGVHYIPVGYGELASGLIGDGRMAEPEDILNSVTNVLRQSQQLAGKHIVITAGPTHEKIDPVRYIGNASTGKMGIAIARAAAAMGAKVSLIYGPGNELAPASVDVIPVVSALEMMEALEGCYENADVVVFAAAVADFRPAKFSEQKIKKDNSPDKLAIELLPNPDIAASFGQRKSCIHIGFALETDHAEPNALKKMKDKQFDVIILNPAGQANAGIGAETNKIVMFGKDGSREELPVMHKKDLGMHIAMRIASLLNH